MFCVKCGNKMTDDEIICGRCGFNNRKYMPQLNDPTKTDSGRLRNQQQRPNAPQQQRPSYSNGFANGYYDDEEATVNLKASYIPENFVTENGFRNQNAVPIPPSDDEIQTVSLEAADMMKLQQQMNQNVQGNAPEAPRPVPPVTPAQPVPPVPPVPPVQGAAPKQPANTFNPEGDASTSALKKNYVNPSAMSSPAVPDEKTAEEIKKRIEEAKAKKEMENLTLNDIKGTPPSDGNNKKNIVIGIVAVAVIAIIVILIGITGGKKDDDKSTTEAVAAATTEAVTAAPTTAAPTTEAVTEATTEATTEKVVHKLTHKKAVEATLTTAGNIEFWFCKEEKKYFADDKEEKEIQKEDVVTYPFDSKDANGLMRYNKNKKLYFVKDGFKDETYTGFAQLDKDWYFVVKGIVNEKREAVVKGTVNGEEGKWYVKDGKVSFTTTGSVTVEDKTYEIKDGKVVTGE